MMNHESVISRSYVSGFLNTTDHILLDLVDGLTAYDSNERMSCHGSTNSPLLDIFHC